MAIVQENPDRSDDREIKKPAILLTSYPVASTGIEPVSKV